MTAATEATAIRERLAHDAPTHRTEWAESLLVLSRALRYAGRVAESYRVGRQALDLFRTLVAQDAAKTGRRRRGLVGALTNQAGVVWDLDPQTISFDQVARSDGYTDEAARSARDLLRADPNMDPRLLVDGHKNYHPLPVDPVPEQLFEDQRAKWIWPVADDPLALG